MVDYHKNFTLLLASAIAETAINAPIYYEFFKDRVSIPAVSYYESNNTSSLIGDTVKYSEITYRIKIWSYEIEEIQTLAQAIDATLLKNGFKRTFATEMVDEETKLPYKVIDYKGIGYETKNN